MKLASLLLISLLGVNTIFCEQTYIQCTDACVTRFEPYFFKYENLFGEYKKNVHQIVEKNWTNSDNASRSSTIEGLVKDENNLLISEIDVKDQKRLHGELNNLIVSCFRFSSECYTLPNK